TSSKAVKGMNAWNESNGSDRSIDHASRKSRQLSAPAPSAGTATARSSRHPTWATRGRRITTDMIIGDIGLGLEIPRPGLSLRYRPMDSSPRAKLTDDMEWMSSRLSLVVKNGRSAPTSSWLGEGAFIRPPATTHSSHGPGGKGSHSSKSRD